MHETLHRPTAPDHTALSRMAILAALSRYGVRLPADRMAALVADLVAAVTKSAPDWRPHPDYAKQEQVRRKNPRAGWRRCALGNHERPLTEFGTNLNKRTGRRTPKTSCRKCLSEAQRNRYVSAKKLRALNELRLELVADGDIAGLRCLDCGTTIVPGDQVVCQTGIRHLGCEQAAV